jgi:DNA-binding response OmpR family regulator
MTSGKSILVIEDAPAAGDKVLTALDFEGFDAMGAPDGLEGVELAQ